MVEFPSAVVISKAKMLHAFAPSIRRHLGTFALAFGCHTFIGPHQRFGLCVHNSKLKLPEALFGHSGRIASWENFGSAGDTVKRVSLD
jgi:hypothetical protein